MPHIGASTAEAEENCAVMAANQLRAFLEHGNIRNSVNFPAIELGSNHRLSHHHCQPKRARHVEPHFDVDR